MATYKFIERRLYAAIDEAVDKNSTKLLSHAEYLLGKLDNSEIQFAAMVEIAKARLLISGHK